MPPDATVLIQDNPLTLRPGQGYRGILRVDIARAFVPAGAIEERLTDVGFAGLHVYQTQAELPADWPADERPTDPGSLVWFAFVEGTWQGPASAFERPEPLVAIWENPQPTAAAPPPTPTPAPPSTDTPPASTPPPAPPSTPPASTPPGSPPSFGTPFTAPWAQGLLRAVWPSVAAGRVLTLEAEQALLAVSRLETTFARWEGPESDGYGSWNFGAIQGAGADGSCPAGTFGHRDHHVDQKTGKTNPYVGCFRTWPSALEGMAGFVSYMVSKPAIAAALDSGDAAVVAHGMKVAGYYEALESTYRDRIASNAAAVARALGQPLRVTIRSRRNVVFAVLLTAAAVGTAAAAHHYLPGVFDADD